MGDKFREAWQHMLERLYHWMDTAITNLPNFLLAVIVFSVAYWLSRNLERWIRIPLAKIVKQTSVRVIISKVASVALIAVGLFFALGIMNLDTVLKSLLAGAGVAGLAIGLALQGTLSNSFSGLFLAMKDIVNVGDFVETNGYLGTIEEISLRNTKIRETDNNIVIIPNKQVLENPFKNYGLTKQVRLTIKCGVGYGEDLEAVREIAVEAVREHFPQDKSKEIEFHYLEFGDSSINFQMRFWVDAQAKLSMLEARSEAIMVIKNAFDAHDINIPFPIRTLDLPKSTTVALQQNQWN